MGVGVGASYAAAAAADAFGGRKHAGGDESRLLAAPQLLREKTNGVEEIRRKRRSRVQRYKWGNEGKKQAEIKHNLMTRTST